MTALAELAALCRRLAATRGRLEKLTLVADFLRALPPGEVGRAVAFLTGRPFLPSDPRVLGVRGLPSAAASEGPPLTLADVAAAFAEVADAAGSGSRQVRHERLVRLAARASEPERELLHRIITGEMRHQGSVRGEEVGTIPLHDPARLHRPREAR